MLHFTSVFRIMFMQQKLFQNIIVSLLLLNVQDRKIGMMSLL